MARPVLKWVGGKTQLLSEILSRFPKEFGTYHEPFVGGGAVFFGSTAAPAHLFDVNGSLMDLYKQVKTNPQDLAAQILELQDTFNSLGMAERKIWFYQLREQFNTTPRGSIWRSSAFVALNKTCFNGIYRENAKGLFNVPFNHSKGHVRFLEVEALYAASSRLQSANLHESSFEKVLDFAVQGDFVYFDPPYVPISKTASFTAYSSSGFDITLQTQLIDVAEELKSKGVSVLLSNSYVPWVIDNYSQRGFEVTPVSARRLVAAKGSARNPVNEALIA
jgi:DNA adenine methylase